MRSGHLRKLEKGELRAAIQFSLNKKAPGVDGIGNKTVKMLFEHFESYFEDFYNKLLENVYMPKIFKIGTLIFFQKPGKSKNSAKGLRPITLLPVLGKVMEHLLISRVNDELERRDYFSDNQHGFTRGKSTRTAVEQLLKEMKRARKRKRTTKFCIVVAMDISSAFDRLGWHHIIQNAAKAGLGGSHIEAVRQLLINRQVQYDNGERLLTRDPNMGCPQGGRASPEEEQDLERSIRRRSGDAAESKLDEGTVRALRDDGERRLGLVQPSRPEAERREVPNTGARQEGSGGHLPDQRRQSEGDEEHEVSGRDARQPAELERTSAIHRGEDEQDRSEAEEAELDELRPNAQAQENDLPAGVPAEHRLPGENLVPGAKVQVPTRTSDQATKKSSAVADEGIQNDIERETAKGHGRPRPEQGTATACSTRIEPAWSGSRRSSCPPAGRSSGS